MKMNFLYRNLKVFGLLIFVLMVLSSVSFSCAKPDIFDKGSKAISPEQTCFFTGYKYSNNEYRLVMSVNIQDYKTVYYTNLTINYYPSKKIIKVKGFDYYHNKPILKIYKNVKTNQCLKKYNYWKKYLIKTV